MSSVKQLIKRAVKATLTEWHSLRSQNTSVSYRLSQQECLLRGLQLDNLQLDPNYVSHVESSGDVEVRLSHPNLVPSVAKAFRRGKLVDIVADRSSVGQKWCTVPGIVSRVDSSSILIHVKSIADNFILPSILKSDPRPVQIIQRSTIPILEAAHKSLLELRVNKLNKCVATAITSGHQGPKQENPVQIIHGPPGTGKTRELAKAISDFISIGDGEKIGEDIKVLATAPSHAACDALTMALELEWPLNSNKKLLRLGNKLRLSVPHVAKYLPEPSELQMQIIHDLSGLRNDLLNLGNSTSRIQEESRLVDQLNKETFASSLKDIDKSKVVVSTCLQAMRLPYKTKKKFNLVCIDEAAFAADWLTLPLVLSGIPRIILSGDHFQLPPISGHESLMERLLSSGLIEPNLLNVQYRSNKLISGWSSKYFYDDNLRAHSSVEDIHLADLPNVKDFEETRQGLIFIDTCGQNYHEEKSFEDLGSISNYNEAYVVDHLVEQYVNMGVSPHNIGVITPYWSQVSLLRQLLVEKYPLIDVSTVDGFQGREKELVIISFVRSNKQKNVGFLQEARRINVSVTRAKRCCIVVGDSDTLSTDEGLKDFIDYCRSVDAVTPVEQVILS